MDATPGVSNRCIWIIGGRGQSRIKRSKIVIDTETHPIGESFEPLILLSV